MNENDKNNPIDEGGEGQEPKTPDEDIKAFNFEWTGGNESKEAEEAENTDTEKSEPEPQEAREQPEEKVEDIKIEIEEEKPKKQSKPTKHLLLASILSASSIALLVAFALSLMLGIFPIRGKEVIVLGVSSDGATVPDTDASADVIENFLKSVVTVRTATSSGTGVIITEDGYIVTNYHVIEKATEATVLLYGEKIAVKAEIVGYQADDDVAVLKIDRTGLYAATFADSSKVRYGEKVYAIGNPEGSEFAWSVTQGIVSAPIRQLMMYDAEGILERKLNVVQTDASVNHGNSGGALINTRGELVGIVALKRIWSSQLDSNGDKEPVEGMGFALPASGVLIDVTAIIENGNANNVSSGITIPRPLVGIVGVGVTEKTYYENYVNGAESGVKIVDEEYAKANPSTTFYAPVTGVYVSGTSAGSDAAKLLKAGDIITEVNGAAVSHIYDVMDIINKFNGGDKITVKYYRSGAYHTAELTLRTAAELD